jgi:hypothetical protein
MKRLFCTVTFGLILSGCQVIGDDLQRTLTTQTAYTREYVARTLPLVKDPMTKYLGQQLIRESERIDELVRD